MPILHCPNYCGSYSRAPVLLEHSFTVLLASKAAIHHLIMAMRPQLKGSNVKVIEILPPAVQTELHDQPDIENGRSIGVPTEEFTTAAWKGLSEGKEDIPVGMSEGPYQEGGFERKRQEAFKQRLASMGQS
jgi:short-subunit dehydrogenase involved in D-alanine esterification of teichoic acids